MLQTEIGLTLSTDLDVMLLRLTQLLSAERGTYDSFCLVQLRCAKLVAQSDSVCYACFRFCFIRKHIFAVTFCMTCISACDVLCLYCVLSRKRYQMAPNGI